MEFLEFIENHIDSLTFLATLGGGLFALHQWRLSVKNSQAEYVDKLLERFENDEDIRNFVTKNDYEEDWYIKDFHDPESEKCAASIADKTLFFLDYLCQIHQEKILNKKGFAVFEYNLYAIIQNINTRAYFADLYQYSLCENRKFPFTHILRYAVKNNIIQKEITDVDYYKYIFMMETGMTDVPAVYREIYNKYGKKRFLQTYSRCQNCTNFDFNKRGCKADCDCEKSYWGLSYNMCPKFSFNIADWDENKDKTTYYYEKNHLD